MADAIVHTETRGKCDSHGATGEYGCFQFMPGTWSHWSNVALGYVAEQTPNTERYVALYKIQYHLSQGHDEAEVALIWNQGSTGSCRQGKNSSGVPYNSCDYRDKVLAFINQ